MIFWNRLWFYTANWDETAPAGSQAISLGDDAIRNFKRDVRERLASEHADITGSSGAATMVHNAGRCSVAYYGTTGEVAALSAPPQYSLAFDTTLKSFKYYTGAVWTRADAIPTGSKMLFYADTAPAGWTIDSTLDDKLVFVTKGSSAGGQTGGGAHSTGTWTQTTHTHDTSSHTLSEDEIPQHSHTYSVQSQSQTDSHTYTGIASASFNGTVTATPNTSNVGGSSSHEHGATQPGSTANTWRPASYCFIVCSKD